MKCPNCHSLCGERDTVCYSCSRPLSKSFAAGAQLPSTLALIFMLTGGAIFNSAYPANNAGGRFDFDHMLLAGAVGGVCGVLGAIVGSLVSLVTKKKE
jgi:hypothetical protein